VGDAQCCAFCHGSGRCGECVGPPRSGQNRSSCWGLHDLAADHRRSPANLGACHRLVQVLDQLQAFAKRAGTVSLDGADSWPGRVRGHSRRRGTQGAAVGIAHLAVIGWALRAVYVGAPGPFHARLAGFLLIFGAVAVWLGAVSFPGMTLPQVAAHRADHLFTAGGFLVGSLLSLTGFVALRAVVRERGDVLLSRLGLIALLLATVYWSMHLAFRATVMVVVAQQPAAAPPLLVRTAWALGRCDVRRLHVARLPLDRCLWRGIGQDRMGRKRMGADFRRVWTGVGDRLCRRGRFWPASDRSVHAVCHGNDPVAASKCDRRSTQCCSSEAKLVNAGSQTARTRGVG